MFNLVLSAVMIVGTPILITQVLGMSDTLYGLTQGLLPWAACAAGRWQRPAGISCGSKKPICCSWPARLP